MKEFAIVVAVDDAYGIGKDGALPWRLKEDMKHFRELTTGDGTNVVIMGRKTWDSIPAKFRPLPGRMNVVLSRSATETGASAFGAVGATSLDSALQWIPEQHSKVFVIGGGAIYEEAIKHPLCTELWLTRVSGDFNCDIRFPRYEKLFRPESVMARHNENGIDYDIGRWVRR
jgi:dihydrofolate reductase / thymidylate synthase